MSGFAPAPRIDPVAPVPSLVTSARTLPDGVDWSSGIHWTPVCQPSFNYQYCPPKVDKEQAESRATVHSMPFRVYTPMSCVLPNVSGDAAAIVEALTTVHTPAQLAAALWMGDGYDDTDTDQVTLRRAAVNVSGGLMLDLDDGISQLLVHYQLATGGNGGATIHMPAALATSALGGVPGGSRICWPEGNLYRGPLGSVLVPGPGYPEGKSVRGPNGHGPLRTAAGVTPEEYEGNETGSSWIYVTGPVEYAVGDVQVIPEAERDRIPFRTNLYELWGERSAIVRFDPCSTFATLVANPSPLVEVS